ncbi:MAG: DNA replication/repair protein RecF [Spirochaetaceae bacterium]|nr:MAG: DNA replication/repair protein RecF [Spirochaetaceae bacterium]
MGFRSIRVYNYRNLHNAEIDTAAPEVFLVGENGQGKSNFLEAVYVLCYASSFRTRTDALLMRHGSSETALSGSVTETENPTNDPHVASVDPQAGTSLARCTERRIIWRDGKKRVIVDGRDVEDRKELIRSLPCIVFCHDDIQFVRGAPDMQRYFFDQTLSLDDPLFIDTLRDYRRIVRLRNSALKEYRTELLPAYDRQLAQTGLEIQLRRREAVAAFSATFCDLYQGISGSEDKLVIEYRPSWKSDPPLEKVIALLEDRRQTDLAIGTTTSGPHRDRFRFAMNGSDYTDTASTGQLRLTSLVLRVAQARFFSDRAGRRPLLLLDDVMLELDPVRRARFLAVLPAYDQAFFTFLPDEQFNSYRKDATLLYRVVAGVIDGESG